MRDEVQARRREGVRRRRRKRRARGKARLKAVGGQGTRAERTENMTLMSVTLEVSRLSGWLNACAPCRAERRACDAGRGAGREARGCGA